MNYLMLLPLKKLYAQLSFNWEGQDLKPAPLDFKNNALSVEK